MHRLKYSFFLLFLCLLPCCKGVKKEFYKDKLEGEYITRREGEFLFTPQSPLARPPRTYPWEGKWVGGVPRITKDFFQCRGSALHPIVSETLDNGNKIYVRDCSGGEKHGLPLREGKEFIYPCLIDLLNYLQEKTGKKVVITCGHRCPLHNIYADKLAKSSKHMLGAEVDFYIEGMEKQPERVLELIQARFEEDPFQKLDPAKYEIATPPLANKELLIKLHLPHEGRDFDNQHAFPYLTAQVRFDKATQTKVQFDEKSSKNYLRR